MVSFCAIWVAISYCLADCFIRIVNTRGTKILYCERNSILRTIITPSGKLRAKMTKFSENY